MALSFKKLTTEENVRYPFSAEAHEESYYAGDKAEGSGRWVASSFQGKAKISYNGKTVEFDDFRWLCHGYDPDRARNFMNEKGPIFKKLARDLEKNGFPEAVAKAKADQEMRAALKKYASLTQNAGAENRVKGFDFCFSAPKEVSTIWSLADLDKQKIIEQCQRDAIAKAAAYINANLIITPRGSGGATFENAVAPMASFSHFTSREGDPNLHNHLIITNVCQRKDGTYGTIESSKLLRWQGVVESIYHIELARGLTEKLGLQISVTEGEKAFDIANAPSELKAGAKVFSKRRNQIIEAAGGEAAAKALSRAAENHAVMKDRATKDVLPAEIKRAEWAEEAAGVGLTRETVMAMIGELQPKLGRPSTEHLEAVFSELEKVLTSGESTFSEARFLARFGFRLQGKAGSDTILDIGKSMLPDLIKVGKNRHGESVYSTQEMVALEAKMIEDAKHLVPQHSLERKLVEQIIASKQTDELIAMKRSLTNEQADAVRHVVYSPRTVSIYSGAAGSGKSFSGTVVKDCLHAAGYTTVGLSLSWKAADVMKQESGIENARAIAGFLKEITEGKIKLNEKSAVIIDEAGLVDSRSMARIVGAVREAGGKMILTGDTRQLLPVAAGGALNSLAGELGEARIDTVYRQRTVLTQVEPGDRPTPLRDASGQPVFRLGTRVAIPEAVSGVTTAVGEVTKVHEAAGTVSARTSDGAEYTFTSKGVWQEDDWQRHAGIDIALGNAKDAVAAYAKAGNFRVTKDREAAVNRLVKDWATYEANNPKKSAIVIAVTRKDVADLNNRMRELARKAGKVSDEDHTVTINDGREPSKIQLAAGDRVQFRRNIRDSSIYNRNTGVVETIGRDDDDVLSITIRLDDGRRHTCSTKFGDPMFDPETGTLALNHAWAMTCYSSQGQTKDHAFVLHDERMDRRLAYVACSRHRDDLTVYADQATAQEELMLRVPDKEWRPVSKITDEEVLSTITKSWSRNSEKLTTFDWLKEQESVEEANARVQMLREEEKLAVSIYRSERALEEALANAARPALRPEPPHPTQAAAFTPSVPATPPAVPQVTEPAMGLDHEDVGDRLSLPNAPRRRANVLIVGDKDRGDFVAQQRAERGECWIVVAPQSENDSVFEHPVVRAAISDPSRIVEYTKDTPIAVQARAFEYRRIAKAETPSEASDCGQALSQ